MALRVPKLSELQPRERLLAVIGGLVILVVILDRLVLSPWLAHIHAAREEIRDMQQNMRVQQQMVAQREYVFTQLSAYQRYLEQPVLDDEHQMSALTTEIQALAQESHVTLDEVKVLPVEVEELFRRYAVDIQMDCTLEEWVQFVIALESSPSLYKVVRARLGVSEEVSDRLQATLRVTNTITRVQGASPAVEARLTGTADAAVR